MSEERVCKGCGSLIPRGNTYHQNKKVWCSRTCQTRHYNERTKLHSPYPGIARATVGAIGELRVCSDLLSLGYEVFRAVSPSCSCDIAVLKNEKLLRIEARTGYKSATSGAVIFNRKDKDRSDHYAVVLPGEILYIPPLPL